MDYLIFYDVLPSAVQEAVKAAHLSDVDTNGKK